ncbi:MAG: transposase [Xanthobacteraceae bacterium]|nr:MAG: transposase [Xanthobacteraceae bacterium]
MGTRWTADLERWVMPFIEALGHKTRARMCPAYVAGLIGPGDRKRVQPVAARDGAVSYDQLHHFISNCLWDAAPLMAVLLAKADRQVGSDDAWLIIDDTALPKKGAALGGYRAAICLDTGQERQLPDNGVGVGDVGVERSADDGKSAAVSA